MIWPCDVCLLVLDDRTTLLTHVVMEHINLYDWGTSQDDGSWQCDVCLLVLDDDAMLREHFAAEHLQHLDPYDWSTPMDDEEEDADAEAARRNGHALR